MYTVCPKCALTLAVSAEDLRAGQGYVRCGRCSNVFNALLTLTEGASAGNHPRSPMPPPPAEMLAVQPQALPEETPSQAARLAPQLTVHDLDFNEDPPSADSGTETHEYRHTGTFETIVLEGDAITQTEEMVPEESVDIQIAEIAQQIAMATSDEAFAPAAPPAEAEVVAEDPVAALAPPEPASSHALAWSLGAVFLLLLLGAQAVHHWRNDLAALPALNAPLTQTYAAFGFKLTPRWDLGAYEIVQLGAESDASTGSAINVRLSITNRATRPQPAPIVRLTLLDRYGKRLAARDLAPQEYLKTPPPRGFLSAGERADSQVSVLDPGPQASSFELDVCLPEASGSLRCANDRPAGKPR